MEILTLLDGDVCVVTSGLVFVLVVVVVGGELVVVRLVALLGVGLLVFVLKLPLKKKHEKKSYLFSSL